MDNNPEKKKAITKYDRINLKPESLTRINQWIDGLKQTFKGIKISRHEMVNWMIESHPPQLSKQELKNIRTHFYDDLQLAAWLTNELKKARENGQKRSLKDLLGQSETKTSKPPKTAPKEAKQSETEILPQESTESPF